MTDPKSTIILVLVALVVLQPFAVRAMAWAFEKLYPDKRCLPCGNVPMVFCDCGELDE